MKYVVEVQFLVTDFAGFEKSLTCVDFPLCVLHQQEVPVYSTKPYIDAMANKMKEQGKLSTEMEHLQRFGFFVARCMPFWYACLLERLTRTWGRKFDSIFLKSSKIRSKRWDTKRKMSVVHKEDVVFRLACEPVTRMMEKLGMLDVVDGEGEKREVGDCSALKSLARKIPVGQGMHEDTPSWYDWGNGFGFSSITAGSKLIWLDVYPESFSGGVGTKGVPARVEIKPGETIVFNGLLRHRGVSYERLCIRWFVSLVVKRVVEEAEDGQPVLATNRLERASRIELESGAVPISFEEWKQRYQ